MVHQSLARRYRPALFSEMVGQDGTAKALTSAIRLGRIPQGVIFTGVRGIGKTTTARLYAKALNCASRRDDGEPCNVCDSCLAIARGAHEDVLEIDGASNTGVADVRALQETLSYVPQRSQYRIYIIDEVHMLSQAAFNALLKTLEEPPAHVVFVFATTELAKVPATIVGRCQTFHLTKLPIATIRERLGAIVRQEAIEAEDKALALIAREGHGSMRDALTLLDQAIAIGGGKVTLASLGPVVSRLSSTPYLDLLSAFVRKDAAAGTRVLETLDAQGAEFADVAEQLAGFARHAFVVRDLGVKALDTALLGLDDDETARLAQIAGEAPPLDLNRIFRTLVKCRADLDGSAIDRYIVENYLFEWCLDPGLPDIDALLTASRGGAGERSGAGERRGAGQRTGAGERSGAGERGSSPARPASSGGVSAKAATAPPTAAAGGVASDPAPRSNRSLLAELAESVQRPAAATSTSAKPAMPAMPAMQSPRSTTPPAAPAAEGPAAAATVFPATWRALVDTWKREKPLQARKLEDTHPLSYGADAIAIAVPENSPSNVLLSREEQVRIREQFKELFGFVGTLTVVSATDVATSAVPVGDEAPTRKPLPETILSERAREDVDRRARVRIETETGAFAKEALAVLGGAVEDIAIR